MSSSNNNTHNRNTTKNNTNNNNSYHSNNEQKKEFLVSDSSSPLSPAPTGESSLSLSGSASLSSSSSCLRRCRCRPRFSLLTALFIVTVLVTTIAIILGINFDNAYETTDREVQRLTEETLINTHQRIENIFEKATSKALSLTNSTLRLGNPYYQNSATTKKYRERNLSTWVTTLYQDLAVGFPRRSGLNIRFGVDGANMVALTGDDGYQKIQICQAVYPRFPPGIAEDDYENCTQAAFFYGKNSSSPTNPNELVDKQLPASHPLSATEWATSTRSSYLGPFWNFTRFVMSNPNVKTGTWLATPTFYYEEQVTSDVVELIDGFTYVFATMSFDPSTGAAAALITGRIIMTDFSDQLAAMLPRGSDASSSSSSSSSSANTPARAFLTIGDPTDQLDVDENPKATKSSGHIVAASHQSPIHKVVYMNETNGIVYENCFRYVAVQGCFFNFSRGQYFPFRLMHRFALGMYRNETQTINRRNNQKFDLLTFEAESENSNNNNDLVDEYVGFRSILKNSFVNFQIQLYVFLPVSYFEGELRQARATTIALSVVISVLGVLIAYLLIVVVTAPVKLLAEKMRQDPFAANLRTRKQDVEKREQRMLKEQLKRNQQQERDQDASSSSRLGNTATNSSFSSSINTSTGSPRNRNFDGTASSGNVSSSSSTASTSSTSSAKLSSFFRNNRLVNFLADHLEEIVELEEEFASFREVIDSLRGFMLLPPSVDPIAENIRNEARRARIAQSNSATMMMSNEQQQPTQSKSNNNNNNNDDQENLSNNNDNDKTNLGNGQAATPKVSGSDSPAASSSSFSSTTVKALLLANRNSDAVVKNNDTSQQQQQQQQQQPQRMSDSIEEGEGVASSSSRSQQSLQQQQQQQQIHQSGSFRGRGGEEDSSSSSLAAAALGGGFASANSQNNNNNDNNNNNRSFASDGEEQLRLQQQRDGSNSGSVQVRNSNSTNTNKKGVKFAAALPTAIDDSVLVQPHNINNNSTSRSSTKESNNKEQRNGKNHTTGTTQTNKHSIIEQETNRSSATPTTTSLTTTTAVVPKSAHNLRYYHEEVVAHVNKQNEKYYRHHGSGHNSNVSAALSSDDDDDVYGDGTGDDDSARGTKGTPNKNNNNNKMFSPPPASRFQQTKVSRSAVAAALANGGGVPGSDSSSRLFSQNESSSTNLNGGAPPPLMTVPAAPSPIPAPSPRHDLFGCESNLVSRVFICVANFLDVLPPQMFQYREQHRQSSKSSTKETTGMVNVDDDDFIGATSTSSPPATTSDEHVAQHQQDAFLTRFSSAAAQKIQAVAKSVGSILCDFNGDYFIVVCQIRTSLTRTRLPTRFGIRLVEAARELQQMVEEEVLGQLKLSSRQALAIMMNEKNFPSSTLSETETEKHRRQQEKQQKEQQERNDGDGDGDCAPENDSKNHTNDALQWLMRKHILQDRFIAVSAGFSVGEARILPDKNNNNHNNSNHHHHHQNSSLLLSRPFTMLGPPLTEALHVERYMREKAAIQNRNNYRRLKRIAAKIQRHAQGENQQPSHHHPRRRSSVSSLSASEQESEDENNNCSTPPQKRKRKPRTVIQHDSQGESETCYSSSSSPAHRPTPDHPFAAFIPSSNSRSTSQSSEKKKTKKKDDDDDASKTRKNNNNNDNDDDNDQDNNKKKKMASRSAASSTRLDSDLPAPIRNLPHAIGFSSARHYMFEITHQYSLGRGGSPYVKSAYPSQLRSLDDLATAVKLLIASATEAAAIAAAATRASSSATVPSPSSAPPTDLKNKNLAKANQSTTNKSSSWKEMKIGTRIAAAATHGEPNDLPSAEKLSSALANLDLGDLEAEFEQEVRKAESSQNKNVAKHSNIVTEQMSVSDGGGVVTASTATATAGSVGSLDSNVGLANMQSAPGNVGGGGGTTTSMGITVPITNNTFVNGVVSALMRKLKKSVSLSFSSLSSSSASKSSSNAKNNVVNNNNNNNRMTLDDVVKFTEDWVFEQERAAYYEQPEMIRLVDCQRAPKAKTQLQIAPTVESSILGAIPVAFKTHDQQQQIQQQDQQQELPSSSQHQRRKTK